MPLPRELTVEQCRLLQKPDLVERYQQFRKILQTIEKSESLGVFAKRPAFAWACEELDKLAVRMSRDRYRIGFLGVSQAGKSTTAGCVVDATKDEDNPAPPGGKGKAATAVATRIRPVRTPHPDCRPDAKHHVQLLFFTEEQFKHRLRDIFGILDLKFDETAGAEKWLAELNAHGVSNPTTGVDDRNTAIRLIQARNRFGAKLLKPDGDSPATENGFFDLEKRRSYVVHPDNDTLSETLRYALLREMRIWYYTDAKNVPDTLELIDLPGLGVERESDEALTTAFLNELDGAFLFSTRNQLTGKPAATLAKHLRQQFGETLAGRMWLVATFMHELTDLDDPKGTLKTLDEQITKHGFVRNNVVFVATGVFQALNDKPEAQRSSVEAWKACIPPAAFHPEYDENNSLIIPKAIEAFPAFAEAFRGLAFDGGISRIRNLMTKNVEDEVRRQTQEHAFRVMNDAIQALTKDLAASRQMGGMTHEQMVDAAKAASAIEAIAEGLRRPNEQVDGVAEDIIESLGVLLEGLFGDRTTNPTLSDSTSFGNALKRQGIVKAREIIPEAVFGVRDEIDAIAKECSAMSVETVKHAMQKWQEDCLALKDGLSPSGESFLEPCLDGFQMSSDLADEMWSNGRGPSVSDYRDLMKKKIVLVSHEFVSRLAKELAGAVTTFSTRMRSVGEESVAANPAHLESIKSIESELQQLQTT